MSLENKHMHCVGLAALALLIALAAQPTDAQDSAIRYGRLVRIRKSTSGHMSIAMNTFTMKSTGTFS